MKTIGDLMCAVAGEAIAVEERPISGNEAEVARLRKENDGLRRKLAQEENMHESMRLGYVEEIGEYQARIEELEKEVEEAWAR